MRSTVAHPSYEDRVTLVAIDPDNENEETLATSLGWMNRTRQHDSSFTRTLGDLLTFIVYDDEGDRTGVWALGLAPR